jgi:uncharacterized glyoxalase superfamily protein PhnB
MTNPQMGVSAQLSVRGGRAAIAFYRAAFGAAELYRVGGTDEDESVVAQLAVGGSSFESVAAGARLATDNTRRPSAPGNVLAPAGLH